MEHAPLIIHLKDREGRYLLANPECAKLFGRDPALVVGLTPFDLLPPETAAEADRVHREVVETGRTLAYEEYDPRVGGYNWTHTIRFPVRDRDGRVAVVGCIALDITERKRAEEALKASEARLAAFMEHAPVGCT
jgi:PAS domain S-box-containing protein